MFEWFWLEIPKHFPMVVLDAFVIMPDHIHGIIHITFDHMDTYKRSCHVGSFTVPALESNAGTNTHMANISPKPGSLSAIIRSYKSECTKTLRKKYPDFAWQGLFHDRIIRNTATLNRIRKYIQENPKKEKIFKRE